MSTYTFNIILGYSLTLVAMIGIFIFDKMTGLSRLKKRNNNE